MILSYCPAPAKGRNELSGAVSVVAAWGGLFRPCVAGPLLGAQFCLPTDVRWEAALVTAVMGFPSCHL